MSVIFKTLKKLKTESEEKENGKNKLMRRKRIHFFNHPLYSPSAVLLALLIFTVIGSGTLYGYYHLRETRSGNTKVITVPKTDIGQSTGEDTSESSDIKGLKSLNQEKGPELNRIEYLPPRRMIKMVRFILQSYRKIFKYRRWLIRRNRRKPCNHRKENDC